MYNHPIPSLPTISVSMTLLFLMAKDRRCLLSPLPSLIINIPLVGTANPLKANMACLLPPFVIIAVQPQVSRGKTIRLRTVACPTIPPLMTPKAMKLILKGIPDEPSTRARKQSRLPRAQSLCKRHRTLKVPSLTRPIRCSPLPRTSSPTNRMSPGDL